MKPHHCTYCGKLLRTWHEKEAHIDERLAGLGCDQAKPEPASDAEIAYQKRRDELRKKSWDRQKMDQRIKEERDAHAPLTFNPFARLLAR